MRSANTCCLAQTCYIASLSTYLIPIPLPVVLVRDAEDAPSRDALGPSGAKYVGLEDAEGVEAAGYDSLKGGYFGAEVGDVGGDVFDAEGGYVGRVESEGEGLEVGEEGG